MERIGSYYIYSPPNKPFADGIHKLLCSILCDAVRFHLTVSGTRAVTLPRGELVTAVAVDRTPLSPST